MFTSRGIKVSAVAITALALSSLTACGSSDDDSDSSSSDSAADVTSQLPADMASELGDIPDCSGKRLGVVLKTLSNEHWQEMQKGYEEQGKNLGMDVTVQAAQSESDQTGQLTIASTMANQGYDAFGFSPITEANLEPFLRTLEASDTPSVEVDTGDVADATVYVGPDNITMGKLVGEEMIKQLPDGGEVAEIEGLAGLPATRDRIAGFKEAIEAAGNIDLVASVPADWDREKALNATNTIMQANPNVKAIYANNDTMALGVVQALEQLGKADQVMVYGIDGVPDAIDAVRSGKLTGTVSVFPETEGQIAAEVACRLIEGQEVPHTVVSRMELITKENIDEEFPS